MKDVDPSAGPASASRSQQSASSKRMTPLPFHALDTSMFERAQRLLDEGWLSMDIDLAPVLPMVLARGVGQDWHKAGTFRHHLVGVARTLVQWQQPREVKLLGLLHSVYGNAFVDLVKFDAATERGRLREQVGDSAEHLVYLFCTASRAQFTQRVLAGEIDDDGGVTVERIGKAQGTVRLGADEVAAFVIVTMADFMEQWFSWQDDIFSGFPQVLPRRQEEHWMASLWPGPMRPSARVVRQVSRLGAALHHPALRGVLPLPPVLGGCKQVLTADDEAAATSLYWSVIQQDQPLVQADAAVAVLEQAVRHNPWIGEPQMVLAQLYLSGGRRDEARVVAESALQLFSQWGNAWDKRVQWEAWVAWTRILLQSAADGTWPERIDKLNNLAMRG